MSSLQALQDKRTRAHASTEQVAGLKGAFAPLWAHFAAPLVKLQETGADC